MSVPLPQDLLQLGLSRFKSEAVERSCDVTKGLNVVVFQLANSIQDHIKKENPKREAILLALALVGVENLEQKDDLRLTRKCHKCSKEISQSLTDVITEAVPDCGKHPINPNDPKSFK